MKEKGQARRPMGFDFGIATQHSALQNQDYLPELPLSLQGTSVGVHYGGKTSVAHASGSCLIGQSFPHTYGQPLAHFSRTTADVLPDGAPFCTDHSSIRVGAVFCGIQSPGGHNVIWGLLDALKINNPDNTLIGFLGGFEGLFTQKTLDITDGVLSTYKNLGGYGLLGCSKDHIRTEQVNVVLTTCHDLMLDGLVIIGGTTSNTVAAQLAEIFAEAKCPTRIVGVPVTMYGDLKNQFIETNVGFDTICKVNAQLIRNVCTNALSENKFYYFIRLMGRNASHISLECALRSHPDMVILGEEVAASKLTLFGLTKQICEVVESRAEQDKHHGVILLPEGLMECIPEVYALLQEIHGLYKRGVRMDDIFSQLSPWSSALFQFLPPFIKNQLLILHESDVCAQSYQIETEKLLAHLVETEMNKRLNERTYKDRKFNAVCLSIGYEAMESPPSKFDCDYAYVLGHVCYHIVACGLNGYMATITNLKNPVNQWHCGATPLTAMMTVKRWPCEPGSLGNREPAIHPAPVALMGRAYELYRQNAAKDLMVHGKNKISWTDDDAQAVGLCNEDQDYLGLNKELQKCLESVRCMVEPGCTQEVLKAAISGMFALKDILSLMSTSSTNEPPL